MKEKMEPVPFQDQLAALQELIQEGKVRYVGLSKETPYGVCSMCELAKNFPDLYPKIVSILNSQNEQAVNAYCDLAERHGMTPTTMALSWCYHRELVASTIIGVTSMEQLEENCKAYDTRLSNELLEEIDGIYKQYTDPTKARNK